MRAAPLVRVWVLSMFARWHRMLSHARAHRLSSGAVVLAALIGLAMLVGSAQSAPVLGALDWLSKNEILVGIAAALYALPFVIRHRTHLASEHAQSWLRATPLPSRAFRAAAGLRVALAVAAQIVVAGVLMIAATIAAGRSAFDLTVTIGWLIGGLLLGSLIGAAWRLKQPGCDREESRFIPKARVHRSQPSLAGLARWPIAKALAWHRPENSRVLFIVAALSVPVGASALIGLAILATWTLGSYLVAVVRAVPVVANEAAGWLRPTTLPFASFAWAIGRRAFVHQFIGAVLFGGLFLMLGGSLAGVAYFSVLWLALTLMIGMIGLRQSYLALPANGRILLSVLVVLAAESRGRGWGLPLAALLTAVHTKGVNRGNA